MAILIVHAANGVGVSFYDIGDLDLRPIEKLVPKLAEMLGGPQLRVSGYVVDGTWFGVEPYGIEELFRMPSADKIDTYLEAPKELRLAILAAWEKAIHSLPTASERASSTKKLDKLAQLMKTGKPDRFTLIDDW